MTRTERNEYNSIRRTCKDLDLKGSQLTIRTDAGAEYKRALHDFYQSLGFKPYGITTDSRRLDGKERIVYIGWNDQTYTWEELTTAAEKKRYAEALN